MNDMQISDMMRMQRELYQKHKERWQPREPQHARDHMLFMVEELGEAIAIMKKKTDSAIMEDASVRQHFCEEMSDILMYFIDVLLCYGITPDEISFAFVQKFQKNMGRDYTSEYQDLYTD